MNIIFRDESIVAVDKPAGLRVYGGKDSLVDRLIELVPEIGRVGQPPRYGLIHRLDKETSGIILAALDRDTLAFSQRQFAERQVAKTYLGLVYGHMKPSQGTIKSLLKRSPRDFRKQKAEPLTKDIAGRAAETGYRTEKRFLGYSLLEIYPKTGRMHQIRAQLAWKGNPIVGDRLYQFRGQTGPDCLKRMFLHSRSISLPRPNGTTITLSAPLPEDLQQVLDRLD